MGETNEMYGTNADGTNSEDYCNYCYTSGAFSKDESMDEMIESCVPHVVEAHPDMSADDARKMMQDFFPTLKRWRKD